LLSGKSVSVRFTEQAALTARLMLYGLMAVVLMAMDQRGQYVPRFRSLANYLVEPVYYAVEWPVRALRGVFGYFQSAQALRRENDQLQKQLLQQEGSLQRLDWMAEENARLRALVDGASGQEFEFQFAELVEVDLDPFSHRVIIDRGADRGVEVGQAVLDGAGVMGQVEEVHFHTSTVRLISDPNHALPVQINRTGLRGVAFGTGTTARLDLPSVPREADVRDGDLIVTSGLGGRFPGGYPVATVALIDRQEGQTFARVEATPLAALDRGREVLLIKPLPAAVRETPALPSAASPEPVE
jgi:rod shape-determining protein MreC